MVEQQRESVGLISRCRVRRQSRAEIAETRWCDDPEARTRQIRPPPVDAVDVGAEHAVAYEERDAIAPRRVLDCAKGRLKGVGRDRVEAIPGPLHFLSVGGHRGLPSSKSCFV